MISTVPATKRTPRLAPTARRRQILHATERAIAKRGYLNLTIDAIAKEAAITRPVIYDQFGDLDGLLDAMVNDVEARAMAAVAGALPESDPAGPPAEILSRALSLFLTAVRDEPDPWRIILLPPEGTPGAVRGRVEQRRAEFARQVSVLAADVLDRSRMLASVNRDVLGKLLIAIAEDLGRLLLEKPDEFTPERLAQATGRITHLLGAGAGPRPGAEDG